MTKSGKIVLFTKFMIIWYLSWYFPCVDIIGNDETLCTTTSSFSKATTCASPRSFS